MIDTGKHSIGRLGQALPSSLVLELRCEIDWSTSKTGDTLKQACAEAFRSPYLDMKQAYGHVS